MIGYFYKCIPPPFAFKHPSTPVGIPPFSLDTVPFQRPVLRFKSDTVRVGLVV